MPLDMRTAKDQEQDVINYVKKHGGFSIFWVTDNQKRACAATRLVESGRIVRIPDNGYPWCGFKVVDNHIQPKMIDNGI